MTPAKARVSSSEAVATPVFGTRSSIFQCKIKDMIPRDCPEVGQIDRVDHDFRHATSSVVHHESRGRLTR